MMTRGESEVNTFCLALPFCPDWVRVRFLLSLHVNLSANETAARSAVQPAAGWSASQPASCWPASQPADTEL